ncbi:hypothetical protein [Hymenobacter sp. HDW8]|uniref:hypothetical protein n=1 Tax=Hymenobacter sp. HDW8 TaxID=2714932 RepID=UPI001F0F2037|nr:hypothetical protein [Hymenobacter sp. HDW8]
MASGKTTKTTTRPVTSSSALASESTNAAVVAADNTQSQRKEAPSGGTLTRRRVSTRSIDNTQDDGYVNEQLTRVLYALDAFKKGDVSVRLTKQNDDIFADIAEAYNSMVEMIGGVGGKYRASRKLLGWKAI